LGLSQEALALDAGLQRNYVSLMELGRNQPTITTIFKLATSLKIKPAKLIQLVDDEITKP
jgi:transcriptional regulator with XRE-family HTH domain